MPNYTLRPTSRFSSFLFNPARYKAMTAKLEDPNVTFMAILLRIFECHLYGCRAILCTELQKKTKIENHKKLSAICDGHSGGDD